MDREQNVYIDDNGKEYILDENGNKMPPLKTSERKISSGFTHYDSPYHCTFCSRLTCRGGCFK